MHTNISWNVYTHTRIYIYIYMHRFIFAGLHVCAHKGIGIWIAHHAAWLSPKTLDESDLFFLVSEGAWGTFKQVHFLRGVPKHPFAAAFCRCNVGALWGSRLFAELGIISLIANSRVKSWHSVITCLTQALFTWSEYHHLSSPFFE